jgi:TetR/AcrR family transcriptional regulator, regulator of cefoperazone and chloramphenicol sensitivity
MHTAGTLPRDSTRDALIEAATEIFARHGYEGATVRAIVSRARANVAAVKYHFGDKLGLYTEVLRATVLGAGHALVPAIVERDEPPQRILRELIRAFVHRILGADRAEVRFRLIAQELARPTSALPRVVKEIIQPNYDLLRRLVGGILNLGRDEETTCFCTLSIISQIIFYARAGSFLHLLRPELTLTPARLDRIANHIADFSLAYLRARSR